MNDRVAGAVSIDIASLLGRSPRLDRILVVFTALAPEEQHAALKVIEAMAPEDPRGS